MEVIILSIVFSAVFIALLIYFYLSEERELKRQALFLDHLPKEERKVEEKIVENEIDKQEEEISEPVTGENLDKIVALGTKINIVREENEPINSDL